MNRNLTYSLISLIILSLLSCLSSSTEQIQKIDAPDKEILKNFEIEISGQIIYQFYQKYGFTDVEEQVIIVVRSENTSELNFDLPLDSVNLESLEKIDHRKFIKDKPINFAPEKRIQADVRLSSKEYGNHQDEVVYHSEGKYQIIKSSSIETIVVFDNKTKLMYIESKKNCR